MLRLKALAQVRNPGSLWACDLLSQLYAPDLMSLLSQLKTPEYLEFFSPVGKFPVPVRNQKSLRFLVPSRSTTFSEYLAQDKYFLSQLDTTALLSLLPKLETIALLSQVSCYKDLESLRLLVSIRNCIFPK